MKLKIITFLILVSVFSCTVEKRKYQKGFYVSNSGKINSGISGNSARSLAPALQVDSCDMLVFSDGTKISGYIVSVGNSEIKYTFCNEKAIHEISKQRVLSVEKRNGDIEYFDGRQNVKASVIIPSPPPLATTTANVPIPISSSPQQESKTTSSANNNSCETIFLRNGEEVQAKVIEVGVTTVRYKLCNLPDGPDFIKDKSSIFMIRYPDGSKDVFKEVATVEAERKAERPTSKKSSLAVLSLVFSILGVYPLTILGSVVGLVTGLIYIRTNPFEDTSSRSRKQAVAGIVISGIVLGLFATLLLLIIFI